MNKIITMPAWSAVLNLPFSYSNEITIEQRRHLSPSGGGIVEASYSWCQNPCDLIKVMYSNSTNPVSTDYFTMSYPENVFPALAQSENVNTHLDQYRYECIKGIDLWMTHYYGTDHQRDVHTEDMCIPAPIEKVTKFSWLTGLFTLGMAGSGYVRVRRSSK